MSSEEAGSPVSFDVPKEVRSWLERAAERRGLDTEAYLRELLAAHRAVADDRDGALDDHAHSLVDEEELDERVADVREEFADLIEDVRSRVIQVKRETDDRAPADHGHEDLEAALSELRSDLDSLRGRLEEQDEALAGLRDDVDDGFENFEEVLEYLVDATDEHEARVDRLARATLELRDQVRDLAGSVARRERADELKRDAALEGIEAADCEDCGRSVRVALLTGPECPYCAAGFVDLEPKRGFLGSPTLTTGDRPALAAGGADAIGEDPAGDREGDREGDRPDPASVDWSAVGGDRG